MANLGSVDDTGLQTPRLAEIKAWLEDQFVQSFGEDVDLNPDGPIGQLIGVLAVSGSRPFELLQTLQDSVDPDTSSGIWLDNVLSLMGLTREVGRQATAIATATGSEGTTIPVGKEVRSTQGDDFLVQSTVTIPASGSVSMDLVSRDIGDIDAPAGTWTIQTPVLGWTGVTVATAGISGASAESDVQARIRRRQSFQIQGQNTLGSIAAAVLELTFVDQVLVLENEENVPDSNGLPPHSFRVVVWPAGLTTAQSDELVLAIYNHMPGGIKADGDQTFEVEDSQGNTQPVAYSYATEVPIGIEVDITKTSTAFPADGVSRVYAAVLAVINGMTDEEVDANPALGEIAQEGTGVGEDVEVVRLTCAIATVPGVRSIVIRLDRKATAFPPIGVIDIPIDPTEKATLDDDGNPATGDLKVQVV